MHVRKRYPLYPSEVLIDIHRYCRHICRVFYVQANRGARLPELMIMESGKVEGGNNNSGNNGENGKIKIQKKRKRKVENGNGKKKNGTCHMTLISRLYSKRKVAIPYLLLLIRVVRPQVRSSGHHDCCC